MFLFVISWSGDEMIVDLNNAIAFGASKMRLPTYVLLGKTSVTFHVHVWGYFQVHNHLIPRPSYGAVGDPHLSTELRRR